MLTAQLQAPGRASQHLLQQHLSPLLEQGRVTQLVGKGLGRAGKAALEQPPAPSSTLTPEGPCLSAPIWL